MPAQVAERSQRADLLENTWLGIVNRLEDLFSKNSRITGKNIQVIPSADLDDTEYLQQQKENKLELPFIGVSPIGVEPDLNSYNTSVMRREGMSISFDEDRANWTVLRLAPVLMTFQVMFVTDDVLTLMRIMDRWTSNEIWSFDFQNRDTNWKVKIQVQADKTIQVPPRSPSAGNARQFKLITTLRAKSYSGTVWFVPSIRFVELQAFIPLNGTIADALENPEVLAQTVRTQLIDTNPPNSPVSYLPDITPNPPVVIDEPSGSALTNESADSDLTDELGNNILTS